MADTNIASTGNANMDDVPLWMQAAGGDAAINYAGVDDRGLQTALIPDEGILGTALTGFAVTQRGAGANFSVDVAAGQAAIIGDDGSNQGKYVIRSIGVVNVATPVAPGSGTRVHRLVAQVRDKQVIGSGTYDWQLWLREDTGTGTPALPASATTFALITIAAGQASVLNANITDLRVSAAPPGTLIAEALRTAGDQTVTAGNKLIVLSTTLAVSANRTYMITYEGRGTTSPATNAHILTFKAATGTSVTTAASNINTNTKGWGTPVASAAVAMTHSGIWVPASTGQWTVGLCVDFFSGSGTTTAAGNSSDIGALRVWAVR